MGWNARLKSGIVLRQLDGVKFCETEIHDIEEMWIDGLENIVINKKFCPGFVEFIQYESASSGISGTVKTGEFIGWTNGEMEFVLGCSKEKHSFHADSRIVK